MSNPEAKDWERYYRAYQRSMVLGLVFALCLGGYNVVQLSRAAGGDVGLGGLLIAAGYFALLLIVHLVTLRGRLWHARGAGEQAVLNDEWVRASRGRAFEIAFWAMIAVQVPMMLFMAVVPSRPEQGVVGMGVMTIVLGLLAFFAAFLYHSRQPSDG